MVTKKKKEEREKEKEKELTGLEGSGQPNAQRPQTQAAARFEEEKKREEEIIDAKKNKPVPVPDTVRGGRIVETPTGETFIDTSKDEQKKLAEQQGGVKVAGGQVVQPTVQTQTGLQPSLEQQQQQAGAEQFIQESGVLEDVAPEFENLGFTQQGADNPLGPTAASINNLILLSAQDGSLEKFFKDEQSKKMVREAGEKAPEAIAGIARNELEKQIYQEGLTASAKFGVFVEAIPLAGGLISKFGSGLVDTPTGTIRDMQSQINALREAAEFQASSAQQGRVDPRLAVETIQDMEDRVTDMEIRMKYLIQFSTILRANPEQINIIETELFRTKQKLFVAKQVAAAGALQAPTGNEVYLELRRLKEQNS